MSRLVLVGEGHGEVSALPILVRKVLTERGDPNPLRVDDQVLRYGASRVFRWSKASNRPDYREWIKGVEIARKRSEGGAVLAVYDGDFNQFPPGSCKPFCASEAARGLADAASEAGAG